MPHTRALRWFAVSMLASLAQAVFAQPYPTRPVRIVIPFTAGSAADIIARAMEPAMRERLGQPVVMDNRPGAGGNIAAETTARSAPDGYTVMMGTVGTHAINSSLYAKLSFDPVRDFTPVALVGESPNVLVMHPSMPVTSLPALIDYAKSNPGKINYGSSGAGTSVHLSGELFSTMAGVTLVHVPFKGAPEALTALLGGQLQIMFASLSSGIPLIKAGKLKAIAVTGAARSASMPDLPTMSEAGMPGFAAAAWYGLFGPAGLPPEVTAKLTSATLDALASKEVRERLFAAGVDVLAGDAATLAQLVQSETRKWADVVKASGASAN